MEDLIQPARTGETKLASDNSFTAWDDEIKQQAVEMFLKSGNMKEVERNLNIPYVTLKYWKKTKWWDEYTRAIRGEKDVILSHRVEAMLAKAFDHLEERLERGDTMYNPHTGEMVRVPVKAQVINAISANLAKQRIDLANQPTEHQMHDKDATAAKLVELADAFAAFVGKKPKPKTIEGEVVVESVE